MLIYLDLWERAARGRRLASISLGALFAIQALGSLSSGAAGLRDGQVEGAALLLGGFLLVSALACLVWLVNVTPKDTQPRLRMKVGGLLLRTPLGQTWGLLLLLVALAAALSTVPSS